MLEDRIISRGSTPTKWGWFLQEPAIVQRMFCKSNIPSMPILLVCYLLQLLRSTSATVYKCVGNVWATCRHYVGNMQATCRQHVGVLLIKRQAKHDVVLLINGQAKHRFRPLNAYPFYLMILEKRHREQPTHCYTTQPTCHLHVDHTQMQATCR